MNNLSVLARVRWRRAPAVGIAIYGIIFIDPISTQKNLDTRLNQYLFTHKKLEAIQVFNFQ